MESVITKEQCRASRGLLAWTQKDLASRSGTSIGTVRNFESGNTSPLPAILAALRLALESGGVEFIDGGVRLKGKG